MDALVQVHLGQQPVTGDGLCWVLMGKGIRKLQLKLVAGLLAGRGEDPDESTNERSEHMEGAAAHG